MTEDETARQLGQAGALMNQGRLREAEALIHGVLTAAPDHPDALHFLGLISFQQGKAEAGLDLVRRAIAANPSFALYHVNLANMLFATGDAGAAAEVLETAAGRNPDNPQLLFELGRLRVVRGDPAGAIEPLARAAELEPRAGPIFAALGVAYQQLGDDDDAIAAYETAAELDPQDAESLYNLGTVHMNRRRWADAIAAMRRAVAVRPDYQEAQATLGLLHGRATEYAEAVAPLQRAVELNPDDAESMHELVYAQAVAGDPREAINKARKFLKIHPDALYLYKQMAFAALRDGAPEEALEYCETAIRRERRPTSAMAFKYAALNDLERRDETEFLLDFERLIKVKRHAAPQGYDDIADFNRALVQHLLDHHSLTYAKTNRSMEKGQGTMELFDGSESGAILALKNLIAEMAEEYKRERPRDPDHPFLADPPAKFRITCWGNVYDREGRQLVHFHPPGWLSGVYYPALPDTVKTAGDDSREGWIEFGRPFHMLTAKNEPPLHLVRPEEGVMVMFPSYVGHQTIPVTRSEEKRVSIAFDLVPIDD